VPHGWSPVPPGCRCQADGAGRGVRCGIKLENTPTTLSQMTEGRLGGVPRCMRKATGQEEGRGGVLSSQCTNTNRIVSFSWPL
jgi:hypothetical protein